MQQQSIDFLCWKCVQVMNFNYANYICWRLDVGNNGPNCHVSINIDIFLGFFSKVILEIACEKT
jgi:hypothetical protein